MNVSVWVLVLSCVLWGVAGFYWGATWMNSRYRRKYDTLRERTERQLERMREEWR